MQEQNTESKQPEDTTWVLETIEKVMNQIPGKDDLPFVMDNLVPVVSNLSEYPGWTPQVWINTEDSTIIAEFFTGGYRIVNFNPNNLNIEFADGQIFTRLSCKLNKPESVWSITRSRYKQPNGFVYFGDSMSTQFQLTEDGLCAIPLEPLFGGFKE